MSDKRDWQADMSLCEEAQNNAAWSVRDLIAEQPQMSIYWLQQYAAEKERADKLQAELSEYTEAQWKALEREQKLKEAIEAAINENHLWKNAGNALEVITRHLSDTLSELYPAVMDKEAEA